MNEKRTGNRINKYRLRGSLCRLLWIDRRSRNTGPLHGWPGLLVSLGGDGRVARMKSVHGAGGLEQLIECGRGSGALRDALSREEPGLGLKLLGRRWLAEVCDPGLLLVFVMVLVMKEVLVRLGIGVGLIGRRWRRVVAGVVVILDGGGGAVGGLCTGRRGRVAAEQLVMGRAPRAFVRWRWVRRLLRLLLLMLVLVRALDARVTRAGRLLSRAFRCRRGRGRLTAELHVVLLLALGSRRSHIPVAVSLSRSLSLSLPAALSVWLSISVACSRLAASPRVLALSRSVALGCSRSRSHHRAHRVPAAIDALIGRRSCERARPNGLGIIERTHRNSTRSVPRISTRSRTRTTAFSRNPARTNGATHSAFCAIRLRYALNLVFRTTIGDRGTHTP